MPNETSQQDMSVLSSTIATLQDTMKRLQDGNMDVKTAQTMVMIGNTVINAANAETNFIKAVKAIPCNSVFGTHMRYLEPQIDDKEAKAYEKKLVEKRKAEKIDVEIDADGRTKSTKYGPTAEEWQ